MTRLQDLVKENVQKLKEELVSTEKELSICNQITSISERELNRKLKENMTTAIETEQLKWKNTWHNIIAKNQTASLKIDYQRMSTLVNIRRNNEANNENKTNNNNKIHDQEIRHLTERNKKLEQQIQILKKNLPSELDMKETQKEISFLQERNDKLLKRMKAQLRQLRSHNVQAEAYLKCLRDEVQD
ncbi:uncharacterized protein LOC142333835 isoform X2 [Lycorma delicatula]|uniref:uncharacterized protein LOC142333835 isoform X2 n=1 Tax=Lycorma delicatula TaxID=130591 RepID=UPI003F50F2DB